jgi:hypothetical protein
MNYLKYFLAGFFSTLVIHQGLLHLLHLCNIVPAMAFSMKPTWPLGVPAVISLAFFGGLWGIAEWKFLSVTPEDHFWLKSFCFGAVMPTLIAIGIVFPLKGIEVSASKILLGLILNGCWGLGVGAVMFVSDKYPLIKKEWPA